MIPPSSVPIKQLSNGSVELLGLRCGACGTVAFPYQAYGCETCGAHGAALEVAALPASGRLRNWVTVHRHHRPIPAAPFIVGTVILDAGPAIRAVFAEGTDETKLTAGSRIEGAAIPAPEGDALFFRLTPAAGKTAP